MYINLDKFYSSNYRDFVHRQALEDALKLVAEIYLKDTKVDTILNITFSVDEYGENPIYLTYLDEEKKEHIVKLKPNITEALLERLKEYAKITYVDEQDEKLRQELTQIIEQSKLEAIDTANNFTISHTNEVKNDILNIINQTTDYLREYCDNKCEMTLLAGKNYTDAKADEINQRIDEEHEYNQERYVIGTINKDGSDTGKRFTEIGITPNKKQYAHLVNFVDARNNQYEINHASGYLLNYDGYTNLVTNLSKAGIPIYLTMQDGTPLFVSEISFLASEFTNQDFISAELKDGVNDIRGFLINQENLEKLYSLDLSLYATKEELNSLDSKVDLVNQQVTELEEDITPLTSKLSNIWGGHKAPFIYWVPNIDINTMKLENKENDVKVTLNDGDVVYWRKNEYQPVNLSNYYSKPESDEKYATKGEVVRLEDLMGIINPITETVSELDQRVVNNTNEINALLEWKLGVDAKLSPQTTTTTTRMKLYANEIHANVNHIINKIPVTPTLNRLIIYDNDVETWYNGHLEITLNTPQTLSLSITTFDISLTDDFFSPKNSHLMFATADYSDNLGHYISTSFSSFDPMNRYYPLFSGIRSYAKKDTDIMTEQKISLSFIVRRIKNEGN